MLKSKQHLKDYLTVMSSSKEWSLSEEVHLVEQARNGNLLAFRELVEAYLPKVVSWVSPYRGEGLSFQELIAVGNLALMEAIKSCGQSENLEERAFRAVRSTIGKALKLEA